MTARIRIPEEIQHRILDRSRRRCALCIHFNNDWQQKEGQLAHVDRNPANCAEDNLAYLCLPHRDDYDTKRRQTKSLTVHEGEDRTRSTLRVHRHATTTACGGQRQQCQSDEDDTPHSKAV